MTPIEIQNYEFGKQAVGGYSTKQVDDFLEAVLKDFEQLYRENKELKDRITVLNDSLKNFKAMEDSLQNTLLFAQNTADDIKRNAQEKADIILEEARVNAGQMITDAEKRKQETERGLEDLKSQHRIFKSKYEALLHAELELLNGVEE